MSASIVVGDTVTLNSGSPLMTVVEVRGDTIDCIWIQGDAVKRLTVPKACLDKNN
jgi:uncharacterized protein YodC (DUF2158 family)